MNDIIASASIYAAPMSIYYALLPSGAATHDPFWGRAKCLSDHTFYGEVNNTYLPQTFGPQDFSPVSSVILAGTPPFWHLKDFVTFPLQIKKTPLYLHCNPKGKGVNLNPDSTSSTPYLTHNG